MAGGRVFKLQHNGLTSNTNFRPVMAREASMDRHYFRRDHGTLFLVCLCGLLLTAGTALAQTGGDQAAGSMEKGWQFRHVGIVVKDLEKAVEYYRSLGIAKFASESVIDSSKIADFQTYGKTPVPPVRDRLMNAQIGPITYEFIQPTGDTPNRRFLDSHGEGISHICFAVDNVQQEVAKLVARGATVVMTGMGGRFAYVDTGKVGNVLIELVGATAPPKGK
jgi:methylmalonyl-CoA/ethylmalonyl-CoA epimerase